MKNSFFILVCISLLIAGKAYSQDNVRLIKYDEEAFERTASKVNHEDYNKKELYAVKVLSVYGKQKGVTLDFTENDYNAALGEVKRLTNTVSDLENAKQRLDEDLTAEKEKSSGLEAEKRELTSENNNMKKLLSAKSGQDKVLEQKEADIADLRDQIMNLTRERDSLRRLAVNNSQLLKDKNDAINQQEKTLVEKQKLQSQLEERNAEVTRLKTENNKFQKAFDDTKTKINGVYNTNSVKPISDMNPAQLESAQSSFLGMKSLLAIDQTVYKDLEGKVNEMASWKALVEPMRDAKQYMKGKYDDKQRRDIITAINKVNIDKKNSKADEKTDILSFLNDQAQVYENYCQIIRNLENFGCLPTIEQLQNANNMLDAMTSNNPFYHESVYVAYDSGINMIKIELSKSAPSDKVKTAAEFEKFINELRKIF